MEQYTKIIELLTKLKFDESSVKDGKKRIEEIGESMFSADNFKKISSAFEQSFESSSLAKMKNLFSEEEFSKMKQQFITQKQKLEEIETLKQAISEIEMFDKDNEHLGEMKEHLNDLEGKTSSTDTKSERSDFAEGFKDSFEEWKDETLSLTNMGKNAFTSMKNTIEGWADKALKSIKDFVSDAIDEIKKISEYDVSSSYTYNKDAVDMMMDYGLTGSSAYGMTKALEAVFGSGATMETYLEALPTMNENQKEYFQQTYDIAVKTYESSSDVAATYQEFKAEWSVFKQDMQSELISFFMENKDAIVATLKALMSFLQWFMGLFGKSSGRTESEKSQAAADILGVSSTTTNSSSSSTINMTNTYNGVGKSDQNWLANVGAMTYQQIIAALK